MPRAGESFTEPLPAIAFVQVADRAAGKRTQVRHLAREFAALRPNGREGRDQRGEFVAIQAQVASSIASRVFVSLLPLLARTWNE